METFFKSIQWNLFTFVLLAQILVPVLVTVLKSVFAPIGVQLRVHCHNMQVIGKIDKAIFFKLYKHNRRNIVDVYYQ